MKTRYLLFTMLALLVPNIPKAAANRVNGILPYSQPPISVTKGGEVGFHYYTSVATSLTYSYDVRDANNNLIYTKAFQTLSLNAKQTLIINYFVRPNTFSVGQNRLIFTYKSTQDAAFLVHTSSFYGYTPGVNLNLNNGTNTYNAFNTEIEFIYHGYEVGTVLFRRTTFRTSHLTGRHYLATDFAFDFNILSFIVTGNYPATFYKEAILYFKDYQLFPLLSRVAGEAALELKLSKIGDSVSFSPKPQLYVDPDSLQVRSEYRSGFVPSSKLYFPREAYGKVNLTECRLQVREFGFHQFNLVYNFALEIGATYLGPGGLHEVVIIRY